MAKKYDIVIVGAGTAGLSAAIYAVRAGKSVIVLEATTHGGQIVNTPEVENYPGIKKISGFEFANNLYEQAKSLGAEVVYEKVIGIEVNGEEKIVHTAKEDYQAKAVILATGAKNRPLGLEHEKVLVFPIVQPVMECFTGEKMLLLPVAEIQHWKMPSF